MNAQTVISRRAHTSEIFSVVAPVYAFVTRALSFGRDAAWKKQLVGALPPVHSGVILDLACGSGDIALACARAFPGAMIVGADFSAAMLSGFPENKRSRVRLTRQDMHTLAVRSSSIDICTGGYALRNAPDISTAIAELSRVVKPGGTVAILDFSRSSNRAAFFVSHALLSLWGSIWGLVLHGNPRIYRYLAESLACFPDRISLRKRFAAYGFLETRSLRRMFGMIEIVSFKKSDAK
jgi:demethylmenaquinone methyltransferase/2-methoxy-6-polyprenyl-1,4-benzoquinol methylase